MRRGWLFVGCALTLLAAASNNLRADRAPDQSTAKPAAASPASTGARVAPVAAPRAVLPDQALVQKYCATCHNDRAKTGGVSFDGIDPAQASAHAELWERALLKLRGGMMPPQGMPRPDDKALETFVTALEDTLDAHALRNPDP